MPLGMRAREHAVRRRIFATRGIERRVDVLHVEFGERAANRRVDTQAGTRRIRENRCIAVAAGELADAPAEEQRLVADRVVLDA